VGSVTFDGKTDNSESTFLFALSSEIFSSDDDGREFVMMYLSRESNIGHLSFICK
jgi:hypothetical protein